MSRRASSKSNFDLVVFDVDGTLFDTREGIVASVRFAAERCGLPPMSAEEVERVFIGPPLSVSFSRAYGLEGERLSEAIRAFRLNYSTSGLFQSKLYDGTEDLLARLRDEGVQIAVATYKKHDFALKLIRKFGLDRFTDNVHGGDADGKLKKSDLIGLCVEESKIEDRRRALMIGDSENDAEGAQGANVPFLGVTYGYGFTAEDAARLKHPFVGSPLEIWDFLHGGLK